MISLPYCLDTFEAAARGEGTKVEVGSLPTEETELRTQGGRGGQSVQDRVPERKELHRVTFKCSAEAQ